MEAAGGVFWRACPLGPAAAPEAARDEPAPDAPAVHGKTNKQM